MNNISNRWNIHYKIYRKATHTDLYLQWDSHHNLAAKYNVINSLTQSQTDMFYTTITN